MTQSIRFDDWTWDPNTLELRNGSHVATLEPRVAQLFEYMVAHPGELLSRDQLVDAVWDGRVVSDEAVRRAVFNLRHALAVDGGADRYIRTVHKKGYVATFPIPVPAGPEARQNLTPPIPGTTAEETFITTSPMEQGEGHIRIDTRRRRPWVLGVIGAIVLAAVVWTQFEALRQREPSALHTEASVKAPATLAVLPFISLSEAADSQLLADGLTEELFGTLERNRELRLTARSSAFQFKEEGRDARELGGRLGVRYVLEGEIRGDAERVLVQAKLVDSETGTQLWTESYDRPFTDWFVLQQDIAADVAQAIQQILQREAEAIARPGRVVNEEAQRELLRARELLITRSVDDAEKAIEHLQRALTIDPNYALAYARLADAILIQADSTNGIKNARSAVAPLLDKALALDPGLGEAYALRSRLTDDAAAAERDLRHALELNPSYARGYEMLARSQFRGMERIDLALSSIDRAIALDPLSPGNLNTKAGFMMMQGKYPEAIALNQRAIELNPKFRTALGELGFMNAVDGKFADAIGYTEQALALDPRAIPLRDLLIQQYLAVGDIDSARAVNTPATVIGRQLISWAERDYQPLADMIYAGGFGPVDQLSQLFVSQIVLRQALSDQKFARASEWLSAALSFTGSIPPGTHGWGLYPYANLAQLLAASGDTAAASRLQEQITAQMNVLESRYPRYAHLYDQIRAVLLAHAGQSDAACAALERTYTPAPRAYWRAVLENPAFDGIRTEPCYIALLTRIEAHVDAERVRIDEMKRAGKIPNRTKAKLSSGADTAP